MICIVLVLVVLCIAMQCASLWYREKWIFEARLRIDLQEEWRITSNTIKSLKAHDNSIREGNYSYEVLETNDKVFLLGYCKEVDNYRYIKIFPKTSEDVKAKAQNICDMLNEK